MSKYSIILPVRNGGEYVKECVQSILRQTYKDFNFIVLDNNSSDGTREWIESLNDPRMVLIPSDRSLTIEENWGRIKEVEKNEFITLIGHDDILYPYFLEKIDNLVKREPQASLYHTHFDFIDADGKVKRACKPMPETLTGNGLLESLLTNSIDMMGTGYVMRASEYDGFGGIPIKYPNLLFADYELWLNLASKSYETISFESCFAFREHKSTTGLSQDTKLHKALEMFTDYLNMQCRMDTEKKILIKKYGSQFLLFYCKAYAHRLLRTPIAERNGLTITAFVEQTKCMANKLGIIDSYHPQKLFSIWLAQMIDNSVVLRKLFLLFKKIYSKPILN